jgi:flagellar biosynthesis protein FlhG
VDLNRTEKINFGNIVPEMEERPFSSNQIEGLKYLAGRYAHVFAITGGKGGVGKTNVAVNLAIAIAQVNSKTLLIDLDLGLANADLLVDCQQSYNLGHVILGQKDIMQVISRTQYGLYLLPGASGVERLANLSKVEIDNLIRGFEVLHNRFDYIILDTAAGISNITMSFLPSADEIIVVTVPERTAMIDAFALIKLLSMRNGCGDTYLVINMAESRQEALRYADAIATTASKLFQFNVKKLGYILNDEKVRISVQEGKPFVIKFPHSQASKNIRALAEGLIRLPIPPASKKENFVKRLFRALKGETMV